MDGTGAYESEVSQKEKHQYVNAHIWNLERW